MPDPEKPFSDEQIAAAAEQIASGVSEVRLPNGQSTKFHDPKTMLEVRDRMQRENRAVDGGKPFSRPGIFCR